MKKLIKKIIKEDTNNMKNILFINSSHDGGSHCLITDLDMIGDEILKETIVTAVNGGNGSFGDMFDVYDGDIFDNGGYYAINELQETFGFPTPPFNVEHVIYCKSDI